MGDDYKKWEEVFVVGRRTVSVYSHQLDEINEENDNVDIWVDYEGSTYGGDIMTPKWIKESLSSNYMGDIGWNCKHGLVLPNLSKQKIVEAIESLIKQNSLGYTFVLSEEYE